MEPLEMYQSAINRIIKVYDAEQIKCAIGTKNEFLSMTIDNIYPGRSSFHNRGCATGSKDLTQSNIMVYSLGAIVAKFNIVGPYIIKIDTEEHELEILSGAHNTLKNCALVISEISTFKRYVNGYKLSDFAREFKHHGFELLDILPNPNTSPRFMDAVYSKFPWIRNVEG